MERIGMLSMEPGNPPGNSRLDGKLLAVRDVPNPLGEATRYLIARNLRTGIRIKVTGTDGALGTNQVIFMQGAVPAPGTELNFILDDSKAIDRGQSREPKPRRHQTKRNDANEDKLPPTRPNKKDKQKHDQTSGEEPQK